MSSTETGPEIVKTSKAGHILTSRQRRQELLEEFDKSGLSAPKFAQLAGIKYPTFMTWLHQRRRKQSVASSPVSPPVQNSTGLWLETVIEKAQATPPVNSSALMVRFPSGAALEISVPTQAALAAALLRAWEKASC